MVFENNWVINPVILSGALSCQTKITHDHHCCADTSMMMSTKTLLITGVWNFSVMGIYQTGMV